MSVQTVASRHRRGLGNHSEDDAGPDYFAEHPTVQSMLNKSQQQREGLPGDDASLRAARQGDSSLRRQYQPMDPAALNKRHRVSAVKMYVHEWVRA